MMKLFAPIYTIALAVLLTACGGSTTSDADLIEFTVLQINDVYEIAPLEGGKVGGMARVAALRKELAAENPNTIMIVSGDFVSPSLIGTLKLDGEKIAGAQMIDCMNEAGVDYVTFGNHEFDIKEHELQKRLDESKFKWTVCNAQHVIDSVTTEPFTQNGQPVPEYIIHEFKVGEKTLKVGLIGVVLPFNKASFVSYEPFITDFKDTYAKVKEQSDVVLGITHLEAIDDQELAKTVPDIPLLLGGHDHNNMSLQEGNVRITKADANAKTAYIHRISVNPETGEVNVKSELRNINETIDADPEVEKTVEHWMSIADEAMSEMGYDPDEVLVTITEPWDGRESRIRNRPTNLGVVIASSMHATDTAYDVAILNSGSIRVDDVLEGQILQYDVLRTLPFGGGISYADVTGEQLVAILDTGTVTNKGLGGYLQLSGVIKHDGEWLIDQQPIDPAKVYKMVATDFLMQGLEANLGFLKDIPSTTPELVGDSIRNDIRDIWIEFLRASAPAE